MSLEYNPPGNRVYFGDSPNFYRLEIYEEAIIFSKQQFKAFIDWINDENLQQRDKTSTKSSGTSNDGEKNIS